MNKNIHEKKLRKCKDYFYTVVYIVFVIFSEYISAVRVSTTYFSMTIYK